MRYAPRFSVYRRIRQAARRYDLQPALVNVTRLSQTDKSSPPHGRLVIARCVFAIPTFSALVPPSTLGLDREMVANWFEYWLPSTYLRTATESTSLSRACLELETSFGKVAYVNGEAISISNNEADVWKEEIWERPATFVKILLISLRYLFTNFIYYRNTGRILW